MLKHLPGAKRLGREMTKYRILGCFAIELSPVSLTEALLGSSDSFTWIEFWFSGENEDICYNPSRVSSQAPLHSNQKVCLLFWNMSKKEDWLMISRRVVQAGQGWISPGPQDQTSVYGRVKMPPGCLCDWFFLMVSFEDHTYVVSQFLHSSSGTLQP